MITRQMPTKASNGLNFKKNSSIEIIVWNTDPCMTLMDLVKGTLDLPLAKSFQCN